ncbi:hypothetical protein, partial [Enterococcus faecium]|uniref:hypothetical protein n=1 Tax=Enterococcus faecium TaxID=1352 RepID=UPI0035D6F516
KKTSHMAMESKKAYGFLFQISTKTNKKELAIKPLLFVYSLKTGRMASLFFRFWEVKTKLFTCKPPINPIKWCKEKIFHSIPSFKKA